MFHTLAVQGNPLFCIKEMRKTEGPTIQKQQKLGVSDMEKNLYLYHILSIYIIVIYHILENPLRNSLTGMFLDNT